MPLCKRQVRDRGSAVAELAAAIVLVLPITVTVIYVAIESAQAYTISTALAVSAERAARQVAIAYGHNRASAMADQSSIFNSVRFLNIVNSSEQFSIPAGGWSTATNPPTVTVVVTFQSGQHGSPPFPNPDPLNLGSAFVLSSRATCRLE